MLRIAICDDNTEELRRTKSLLYSFMELKTEIVYHVQEYCSSVQLLASLKTETPCQLYLLDILMPGQNGIDLGRAIHEANPNALLIYLSSSPDYAMEAFRVYAFQYVLKPVTRDKLFPVLAKALAVLKDLDTDTFLLKTKAGILRLECSQIQYVEYLNHLIEVYMDDGRRYTSLTMRVRFDDIIASLVSLPYFVKPHKSYLINMNYVLTLQEHDFTMRNSILIPISRGNYSSVKKQYIDFMLSKSSCGNYNGRQL